jgi:hypothetical protein
LHNLRVSFAWRGQDAPSVEEYAEVVGTAVSATKIKMMTWINMGPELGEFNLSVYALLQVDVTTSADMKLANDLVELIHGPQKEIKEMFH